MTTCKRIKYFIETVDSFFAHCTDSHLIKRIIVSDDSSTSDDRMAMKHRYPHFEFYHNDGGQPQSLRFLFGCVDTEYLFHLEDDMVMKIDMDLINTSISILNEGIVDSFISAHIVGTQSGAVKRLSRNGWRYYVHEYEPDRRFWSDFSKGNKSWPGFYLTAGLHRTSSIQSVAYRSVKQHERNFAVDYQKSGFKVAFNCGAKIFEHIGTCSSYYLTGCSR